MKTTSKDDDKYKKLRHPKNQKQTQTIKMASNIKKRSKNTDDLRKKYSQKIRADNLKK